ncbi:hypothetical protein CY34DRAFT_258830 [Suillus luteus UH-Slu-Lm8-n1]|uniref:Uncharacterized protein n=1 Tax=Suillus luteus UH-Slu-Lm8-n1 TaxID=930992 RepID=A0A0D0BAL8_9AGAM|nr:hypothetical protein CY34DRAFT_258830 [Suillus luteus UH-Slu-Lm8-n1]
MVGLTTVMRETVHVDQKATAWCDRPEGDGRHLLCISDEYECRQVGKRNGWANNNLIEIGF